jgi:hypothetical protein
LTRAPCPRQRPGVRHRLADQTGIPGAQQAKPIGNVIGDAIGGLAGAKRERFTRCG